MKNHCTLFLLACLTANTSYSQTIDFENVVPTNWSAAGGNLSISNAHYKIGNASLEWDWIANDTIIVENPGIDPTKILNFHHHTTELFIYNENPTNAPIRFEFLDENGLVNYHFDFIINFEGWRKVDRSYKYDMHAIPGATQQVASMRIMAPASGSGKLFFDDWEMVRARYNRMATRQMPDISGYLSNTSTLESDNYVPDLPLTTATAGELTDLHSIRTKIMNHFDGNSPSSGLINNALNFYSGLNIQKNGNQIKGKYTTPQDADVHLLNLARDYHHNGTATALQMAEDIIWLINDCGFAGGSNLFFVGSRSYHTRNYNAALILIYPHLNATLQSKIFDAFQWKFKMGYFWHPQDHTLLSSDDIHTLLRYMLGAIVVCMEDNDQAIRQLKGLKRYLERVNAYKANTSGWLKADHTSFHHNAHHNSYMYAFTSYTTVLGFLDQTQFQINEEAYKKFREAAYALLIMCNGNHYANSLCGRAPFHLQLPMSQSAYYELCNIGGYILGQPLDHKIAAAYNRVWGTHPELASVPAEDFPEGFWQFNYSPIGVYRQDHWVATLHGINNVFWGSEIYSNANRYGIYQSYGAVEIMYPGGKTGSGMQIEGYDWNRPPGTTTRVLSRAALNPTKGRADERSSIDYAAALRFDGSDDHTGNYGMYGFDFHQKNIYSSHDGSFKFKKSMFCFDDIIVCLGSDIACADATNRINTTLFQSAAAAPTVENGIINTTFPYANTLDPGVNWAIDSWGSGYYVNASDSLKISISNQSSPNHNGNGTVTSGDFAKAWIDHGTAPTHASYEFVVLPNTTPNDMSTFASNMQSTGNAIYEVIQKDSIAHIVHHKSTDIYGYAFFEPEYGMSHTMIESVSGPGLIMLQKNNDLLKISFVDPSTSYLQNSTIAVTVTGVFSILTADPNVTLVNTGNGSTTLSFQPVNGAPADVTLIHEGLFSHPGTEKPEGVPLDIAAHTHKWSVYPNPTKDQIMVYGDKNELERIRLLDASGRNITHNIRMNDVNPGKITMDLSTLSSGLYFIKTKTTAQKVYKQ